MSTTQKKGRLSRMFGKRFRAGSYTAFAAVIVICIAVVVNMMASALPSSKTEIDLTSNSLYSLSDQTKRIAASLDKDVNLYLLATTGNEDETLTRLLSRYSELSDHIHVENIDPLKQPNFLSGYDLQVSQIYQNSVLVTCGDVYRLVSYSDIYVTSYSYDYSYNYTSTTEFDGENALTNAVHYVSSDNLPKVYTLTGHGEEDLSDSVTEKITGDNMSTDSLSLLTVEEIPEDCNAIVINNPSTDLSEDEAQMLMDYLDAGGNVVMITGVTTIDSLKNLQTVGEHMGIAAGSGIVVEGDDSKCYRYSHYLLPTINSHTITDPINDNRYYILMPISHALTESGDSEASVTFLLSTSSSAYLKAYSESMTSLEKDDGDETGTYNLAAISEKGEGKLMWASSSYLLNESIDSMVSGANSDLFVNSLEYMCGEEDAISIRAKSMDSTGLTVPTADSNRWSVIMIGVIPALFIAIGIVIVVRRKRQ